MERKALGPLVVTGRDGKKVSADGRVSPYESAVFIVGTITTAG